MSCRIFSEPCSISVGYYLTLYSCYVVLSYTILAFYAVVADQLQRLSLRVTYVIKLSKAYKASSNVLIFLD